MRIYTLRPYQKEAVQNTIAHFRLSDEPAVIVLPTGAGKSLVIAELARLARHKILVLAHVKELVEQNAQKYASFDLSASIFSAGLGQKSLSEQVTFASIQSIARNLEQLTSYFSLVIIDECHRVSAEEDSQYGKVIKALKVHNPNLKVLGLSATPYRLGMGWIYQNHYHGFVRGTSESPFKRCIYELPLRYMIKNGYLTPPKEVDPAVSHYNFSSLKSDQFGRYSQEDMNTLLSAQTRATFSIISHIIEQSKQRSGVMIFAATVMHAKEIFSYLPKGSAALIIGETETVNRDNIIKDFKNKTLKFLVNVSVLTTGFDAPHVDLIAILRPTESVSLYQQIVGRGLRLSQGKKDCLVLDYAGNDFNLFHPEVGSKKPNSQSEPVQVICPGCGFANIFWGQLNEQGELIEHYGRRCQGLLGDPPDQQQCDYRFRFKECQACGGENDIAARLCLHCGEVMADPDDKLRAALNLKNAMVLRCSGLSVSLLKAQQFKVTYFDEDGASCDEVYDFVNPKSRFVFNREFGRRVKGRNLQVSWQNAQQVYEMSHLLEAPDFVVAKQHKKYGWQVSEKIFDYQGLYRIADKS
ncbi:DEAD/DEAH box helicase [Pseudoalteromonas byunsanensis]|uniref:ATP-dependent helicase n=1 Tax=Pseudoalteromonas byunsanensis TaxID=327939 RepID=A0A1S1N4V1_9GAMM|nr:DEAD/DEAH box helicase [Pseudoalteromonas byunsanensis]OHU95026.1 ATP-dependent helicase [Pseudoalteromonas byunsanensis]